jgi:hypothetical protein
VCGQSPAINWLPLDQEEVDSCELVVCTAIELLWTIGARVRALSKAQESAASVGTLVLQILQIHRFRKWRCAAAAAVLV